MENKITIAQFIKAIERLPEDEPIDTPRVWYYNQKEHWLGWLDGYHGPGAYGRQTGKKRDAEYAYNHIVCSEMLLYLSRAIPLREDLIEAAEKAAQEGKTLMAKSGAIRKIVPWSEIITGLWENGILTDNDFIPPLERGKKKLSGLFGRSDPQETP